MALELVGNNRYGLILMDVNMPVMNGIEVTKKIRKLKEGENLVIVGLTGDSSWETEKKCKEAGMNKVGKLSP